MSEDTWVSPVRLILCCGRACDRAPCMFQQDAAAWWRAAAETRRAASCCEHTELQFVMFVMELLHMELLLWTSHWSVTDEVTTTTCHCSVVARSEDVQQQRERIIILHCEWTSLILRFMSHIWCLSLSLVPRGQRSFSSPRGFTATQQLLSRLHFTPWWWRRRWWWWWWVWLVWGGFVHPWFPPLRGYQTRNQSERSIHHKDP